MRDSLDTALGILLGGESGPTHIESTLIRATVAIVAGLIGAIIAFEFGWSGVSSIIIVYVTTFSIFHLAGYILNRIPDIE